MKAGDSLAVLCRRFMFSAELFERPVHAGRSGRPFRRFLSASPVPAALPAELLVQGLAEGPGILGLASEDVAVAALIISDEETGDAAAAGG